MIENLYQTKDQSTIKKSKKSDPITNEKQVMSNDSLHNESPDKPLFNNYLQT